MGIVNNLVNRFKVSNEVPIEVDDPLLKALLGNETIDRDKAMSIPAVSSNVDLISSMVACMPIKLYKDTGDKIEEIKKDYRLALLNDETKDLLDSFQWKKALVEDYLMSKGGYSYIKWSRNTITGLYYVESNKVTPYKNTDAIYKHCTFMIDTKTYMDWEIFRILRNTKDGVTGTGLTVEISKSLETAFATLLYQLNLVKKGGNKKGFLKASRKLGKEEVDALKEAWANLYANNQENVVVLNNGLEFQESSNTSVEMQLDQSKNTLDKQINNVFHVENNFDETFKKAILPIVKALQSSLNKYLLLEKEKKQGYFYEIDVKEITKANLKDRYSAYHQALTDGWLNKNEVRYEENRDMVEGLDTFNMTLGAVLFDAKTQTYFVPNTGQVKENGENDTKSTENDENITENDEDLSKNEPQGDENTKNEENMKGGEENEV